MQPALPDHLTPPVRAALEEATAALHHLYGPQLHHLVLFGSQARGETHPESDVDLLVVLEDPVDYAAEIRRMLGLKMDILLRHNLLLSCKPVSLATYRNQHHPLMININHEGALLG